MDWGMDVAVAERSILGITQDYQLLKDERGIFSHWQSLVVTQAVKGKSAHDARLVALAAAWSRSTAHLQHARLHAIRRYRRLLASGRDGRPNPVVSTDSTVGLPGARPSGGNAD
jgi:hypothetical protein